MKFDLIIRSGQVVDGWRRLVERYRHPQRTHRGTGTLPGGWSHDELDASGMTVSPGFIDCHSHADLALLAPGSEHEKLRMGVTTEVIGQCGYTAFPVSERFRSLRAGSMADPPGVRPAWDWATLAEYRAACSAAGLTHNMVPWSANGPCEWR